MEETCSVDLLVPEAFSCAVCLELMVCPISCFPCWHSFCEPCLRLITQAGDPLDILCPICRQTILCCGPNNVLKNQILRIDPLMASAYERRLEWFGRQEAYREMRLPGIAGLGILPKLGACLPGGNSLADYLMRTLFGLITGRGAVEICKRLLLRYQQLFVLTFSILMFLLIPCIYLRTILQHPLPSSTSSQTTNESAFLDALFNTSQTETFPNSSQDDGNGTTPAQPFQRYGALSEFPFAVLCFILFVCCSRVLVGFPPSERTWAETWASSSRWHVVYFVAYYLSQFPCLVCFCSFLDHSMKVFIFNSSSYWEEGNQFALLRFAISTFACAAFWGAMLLASAAVSRLDFDRPVRSQKCFKILVVAFFVYYVAIWIVFIVLDQYCHYLYLVGGQFGPLVGHV